jgi:hypothetical protein
MEMDKVSMVVMNWLRSDVLKSYILPAMIKYKIIDEIIISHGREDTYFEYDNPKIVNRKDWGYINENYGLSRRFLAASDAKNDVIFMIDDDEFPTEKAVTKLYSKYLENPNRMYGAFGRNTRTGRYNLHQRFGHVCVLITKFTLFNKELCKEFFSHSDSDDVKQIISLGQPYWNGEDIFMSAIARNYYGNNNFSVNVKNNWVNPCKGRENKRKRAVSSWRGHRKFRTDLVHFCAKKFNIWENYTK